MAESLIAIIFKSDKDPSPLRYQDWIKDEPKSMRYFNEFAKKKKGVYINYYYKKTGKFKERVTLTVN